MKIAIFTDTFYPSTNWIVTSIITSSKELALMWHEILIVTPYNKWIEDFKFKNIEIFSIKGIPAIFYPDFKITFAFTPGLMHKIKEFNPDIFHFHTQFIIWWEAIILWKIMKIPRVWTFHTYIADESYLKVIWLHSKIFWTLWWKYNNFYYKNIEQVLVPSKNAKEELINHWIKKESIKILSNSLPQININEKLKEYYLKDTKTENIVLYIWRLSKEKSLNICLQSIYVVSKEIPDILFVIVWDWPEKKELQILSKKLWIGKNVLFLGKIPHNNLFNSDICEKSKIFFTASPSETQWITIIEAMYFWMPIVWVNEKWVGDLIKDNGLKAKNENYWELAIYLVKLLKDWDFLKKMWAESKRLSKKFDSKMLAKKQEELYKEVVLKYKK